MDFIFLKNYEKEEKIGEKEKEKNKNKKKSNRTKDRMWPIKPIILNYQPMCFKLLEPNFSPGILFYTHCNQLLPWTKRF